MTASAASGPGPAEHAIDAAHRTDILARLVQVQAEHGVRIVLAVESGSRAWGFASPDSDYDVRFVCVRPQAHYLSIRVEDRRDVIEQPIVDEIDLNGWDLRKAVDELLLRKRAASEMADGPPMPVLNRFIEEELARPVAASQPPGIAAGAAWDALDALFLEVVEDGWGRISSFPP